MRFDRRISRRSFLAAAGVSAAALALTACGGSSSTAASTAASTGASSAAGTAAGGTLNIMLETEVQSLDPQIATDGTSFEVIADYTDGLMQMDTDGAAVPAIAESCDISEDGKTYTFHLRDAKWSNGDAVTAADFVFGWQRAVDPANASEYSYMLSDIGQDESTVGQHRVGAGTEGVRAGVEEGLVDRVEGGEVHQAQEVADRDVQLDLEGLVIHCGHAQIGDGLFS